MKKKGMIVPIILFAIAAVLGLVIIAGIVAGFKSDSGIPKVLPDVTTPPTNPSCQRIWAPYLMTGTMNVKNQAIIGSVPSIEKINILEAYFNNQKLMSIFKTDFNYKITLIDSATGTEIRTLQGTKNFDTADEIKVPFSFSFQLQGTNCDNIPENKEFIIEMEVESLPTFMNPIFKFTQTVKITDGIPRVL